MSPLADGPIKFTGELAEDLKIENITKYGRNFSIVRVPYAFKLLIQELNTMNICMRIITEDNIDQLSSMAFSNEIDNFENPKVKSMKSFTPIDLDKDESITSNKTDIEGSISLKEEKEKEKEENEENEESGTYFTNIGDKLEQYQTDLFTTLTSKSQDIFSQAKDAVLSIGKETTFKPDTLDGTKKTEEEEEKTEEKIESILDKPLIIPPSKKPDESKPKSGESNESGDESSQNEFIIVGDPNTPDTNEQTKLPLIASIKKDKDKEKEKEEEEEASKKVINVSET